MSDGRTDKGFTLIELLIVVAIIAILAAIAVPNFLEAQIRAKSSRARADLRALSVAQEAYYTDWNSYTYRDQGDDLNGYVEGFRLLTTPMAYITSIPDDVFGDYRWPGNNTRRAPRLELGTGVAGVASSGARFQNSGATDTYLITSTGPDHIDSTNSDVMGFNLTEGQFPWPKLPNNELATAAVCSLAYDPTNGTVSYGQIYRTGGTVLPGRPGQVLVANSSSTK